MKKTVTVTQQVEIEIDESKFTDEFMAEFRQHFYPFTSIDDHIQHLAQLEAHGILSSSFVEGYGPPEEFGIQARVAWTEEEIEA